MSVDGAVDIHDVHATILHLPGIRQGKLIYRHFGRSLGRTDVHGKIIRHSSTALSTT
jgi:hypothetical protein